MIIRKGLDTRISSRFERHHYCYQDCQIIALIFPTRCRRRLKPGAPSVSWVRASYCSGRVTRRRRSTRLKTVGCASSALPSMTISSSCIPRDVASSPPKLTICRRLSLRCDRRRSVECPGLSERVCNQSSPHGPGTGRGVHGAACQPATGASGADGTAQLPLGTRARPSIA